jgi:hypothetical protein
MVAMTLSVRRMRSPLSPVRGLLATRQALRSQQARVVESGAAQAQQRACARWDNEGGAIPR